jgi:hypothetical protein
MYALFLFLFGCFFDILIPAKVFPQDENAVVCGLEVFVDGKHIVAKVKEKETARKEYREAKEKGHGAYLMEQGIFIYNNKF